jgi:hypothetical protein
MTSDRFKKQYYLLATANLRTLIPSTSLTAIRPEQIDPPVRCHPNDHVWSAHPTKRLYLCVHGDPYYLPEQIDPPVRCHPNDHVWSAHPTKRLYLCVRCGVERRI